jgi:hypothetical protein
MERHEKTFNPAFLISKNPAAQKLNSSKKAIINKVKDRTFIDLDDISAPISASMTPKTS